MLMDIVISRIMLPLCLAFSFFLLSLAPAMAEDGGTDGHVVTGAMNPDEQTMRNSAALNEEVPGALNSPEAGPMVDNTPGGGAEIEIVPMEEPQTAPASNSPASRLQGMETWEILGSAALLGELYEVKGVRTGKLGASEVKITVREARSDELLEAPSAPMTIASISTGGSEFRLPLYAGRRMEFEHSFNQGRPPLLAVTERCGCPDPYADLVHLFMVYRGALRPLGAVSGLDDADGDGLKEPFVYDTSFSDGLGLTGPDRAPVVRVFLEVKAGALAASGRRYASVYQARIDALSGLIANDLSADPGSGDLAPVLEKFLYYRAMGLEKDGWSALEKDIMLYGGMDFPVRGAGGRETVKVAVEEIVSRARKALGKSWQGR